MPPDYPHKLCFRVLRTLQVQTRQVNALLRKSWAYQRKNVCGNIFILCAPILICALLGVLQTLLDNLISDDAKVDILSLQQSLPCNSPTQPHRGHHAIRSARAPPHTMAARRVQHRTEPAVGHATRFPSTMHLCSMQAAPCPSAPSGIPWQLNARAA